MPDLRPAINLAALEAVVDATRRGDPHAYVAQIVSLRDRARAWDDPSDIDARFLAAAIAELREYAEKILTPRQLDELSGILTTERN